MKTNAIEQWIKDAIAGGFVKDAVHVEQKPSGELYFFPEDEEAEYLVSCSIEELLLQPKAWQAVGKTRGWNTAHCYMCQTDVALWGECDCDEDEVTPLASMAWQYKWHQFIDHLADGHDINSSLQEL